MTSPSRMGPFKSYFLGTLTRNAPHTITFWIKLNPGRDNDRRGDLHRRRWCWSVLHDVGEFLSAAGADQRPLVVPLHRRPGDPEPRRLWLPVRQRDYHYRQWPWSCRPRLCPAHRHRQDDTNAVRAPGRPHHVPDQRQKPRRRAGARAAGVRPGAACTEVPRIYGASAARSGPSTVPHDPSAAARSAQDVPCHLPAARERHGGYRHQRRERGHRHRVRAVSVPARKRRHPQAAATPRLARDSATIRVRPEPELARRR